MDCWHCAQAAVGACRFCGRGICADHLTERPYVLELYGDTPSALVVDDALWCNACNPRANPVELPELG